MTSDNSRDSILVHALLLFSRRGYNGTGIQDITTAAGITKPTLYYFFKSKDGLYDALWQKNCTPLLTTLEELCHYTNHITEYERDVFGQLTGIVNEYFSFAALHTEFYRVMVNAGTAPPESTEYTIARNYLEKIGSCLECYFLEASHVHKNMMGKQHQYAVTFAALITAYILLSNYVPAADQTAALVKQFMHGIFS